MLVKQDIRSRRCHREGGDQIERSKLKDIGLQLHHCQLWIAIFIPSFSKQVQNGLHSNDCADENHEAMKQKQGAKLVDSPETNLVDEYKVENHCSTTRLIINLCTSRKKIIGSRKPLARRLLQGQPLSKKLTKIEKTLRTSLK